jgi:integrase
MLKSRPRLELAIEHVIWPNPGYLNHPDKLNPACGLKCVRMSRKDRPVPDPFRIHDAETLIAAIHNQWGEAQGNYDEFRFFTGMRPSEQIALTVADFDAPGGALGVNKARVAGIDRNSTKTGEDRRITRCPRALQILDRQLTLRDQMKRAGKIDHDHLFFQEDGQPIQHARYTALAIHR